MINLMENTEVYQRAVHRSDDDYSSSSGEDPQSDSEYGADNEDNDEIPDERRENVDPGTFQYNRKLVVAALPCLILVLSLVGDLLLIAVSFGAGILIMLDPKGEKKRCVVMLILMFVPCHAYIIYTVFPLIWLSVFNLFLIGSINIFVILTGGLAIIQMTYFRKQEHAMCVLIEQFLFSIYPGSCIAILSWALSTVVSWQLAPFVLLITGFIYLQIFLVPHTSSFKIHKTGERLGTKEAAEDDLNVISQPIILLTVIMYLLSPTFMQLLFRGIHNSFSSITSLEAIIQMFFLMSLSLFLTTLMSLRETCEYTGMSHMWIVRARWVSGAVCVMLCYPVLKGYGLSSHFLPWLPAGVAVYTAYGVLLSDKKFKLVSLATLAVPVVLFSYWLSWLPWKLVYHLLFGLHINTFYILLLINCVLCFLCVYTASYAPQQLFEIVLAAECLVFVVCEVVLHNADLYPNTFFFITAIFVTYTVHRLYLGTKLTQNIMCCCVSIHVTKTLVVLMYQSLGIIENLSLLRCAALYLMSFILIKVLTYDTRVEIPFKQVVQNMVTMSLAIIMNTNPVLHLLCVYFLWEEPTTADLIGLCVITCGVCTLVICSLHLQSDSLATFRQFSVSAITIGVLVIILQPSISLEWSSVQQWGEVGSLVLAAFVFLTNSVQTLNHIFICACLVSICPGIRAATWLYTYEEDVSILVTLFHVLLYVPACLSILMLLFMFSKFELIGKSLEKCVLYICSSVSVLSVMLLVLDGITKDRSIGVLSLPSWKLSLATAAVVSIALKIISTQRDLTIPFIEEKKEKELPRLPLLGNITSFISFFLACLLCPVQGYLQDIWCCAASLILLCLQNDRRLFTNLKAQIQVVPVIITCILILIVASLVRSDIWTGSSWMFARAFFEVISLLCTIPVHFVFWGILWKSSLVLHEQVVVFLFPFHVVYLLYGSSYTSQTLAVLGIISGLWMISNKLPLIPHRKSFS
ncbi:hypothetical protein CHS0354_039280 [Potamilus streckersoni]|uniref:Uncharacterized protein n=1 Tax=Potamilus streckersoni TaxID=2493646 RepID=A0AAE0VFZ5_9BIVA|nr:hypothetical protein CHS0354_039280 [Potamilus streckersoni]